MVGLQAQVLQVPVVHAQFDLSFNIIETAGVFELQCDYSTDLFERGTVERLLGHYLTLLEGAAADPDRRLGELPLLSTAERSQLARWNDTAREHPARGLVHELFERQAARTPDAVAVACESDLLTYRHATASVS